MKILCDYHHGELYNSILRLFEDRLGADVYRPTGREWHDENYWHIVRGNEGVIDQYLSDRFLSKDNQTGVYLYDGGAHNVKYYNEILNVYNRHPHKCITLPAAREMKWDIIISTLYGHFDPMEDFRIKYCPGAKHILQMGNNVFDRPTRVMNVMNSTGIDHSTVPNYIQYFQEFDTTHLNPSMPMNDGKFIATFLINNIGHKGEDYRKLQEFLPDWICKEYGWLNKDGDIHGFYDQCDRMREMGFMWHVKMNGDGYGYNLHRALYAGKPVILNLSSVYQSHRLTNIGFFEDGKTIINFDGKTLQEIAKSILHIHSDWKSYSDFIASRMREIVDFDNECLRVKKFLENLI